MACEGREPTFADLNTKANGVCCWLGLVGVKPGDRVLLFGENSDRLVAALFGVVKAGAVFVPVHPDTPSRRIDFILRDCAPKAIVADTALLENNLVTTQQHLGVGLEQDILLTSDNYPETEVSCASISAWSAVDATASGPPTAEATSKDLAAILYTSGSTKDPKGVMEPHRQVLFATSAINSVIGNSSEDVVLCGIPFSFDYGLYQVFLAFQVGAKLILERNLSLPMAIPRLLKSHSVTGFPAVPSVFALLLRSRVLERVSLPDLRYITSTGDVFPASHIRQLRRLLPTTTVFPMYGLTECKRVSIVPRGELEGRESSVGLPLPGTSVSIVDGEGEEVPIGVTGELIVKGPHVMRGYWKDPVETSKRFPFDESTGERCLCTGDYFEMDREGFLYFIGRDGTFIKSHGRKISPAEIENFLCAVDGVSEAAAVGVPDAVLGEAVHVFVSSTKAEELVRLEVGRQCKSGLAPIERPRKIAVLRTPLPRTKNGKIDRKRLKQVAQEASH